MDDDVWVYTGVTSLMGDQANVGFVLMNQRTMETKYYKVEGAIEDSAMSSAKGQVQNLYVSLLNTNGIVSENADEYKEKSGVIELITPVVIEGTKELKYRSVLRLLRNCVL